MFSPAVPSQEAKPWGSTPDETLLSWEAAIPVMGLTLTRSKVAALFPFGIVWSLPSLLLYRQGTLTQKPLKIPADRDDLKGVCFLGLCHLSAWGCQAWRVCSAAAIHSSAWPLLKPPLISVYINILSVNVTTDKWTSCPCSSLTFGGINLWQRSRCIRGAVTS